jgi:hypothetical protein
MGVVYPGEHAPIVDQCTRDKAHAVMAEPGTPARGAGTRAQVPELLKGLIYGPNGRPMSPSQTRRRGRIYRYYVTREAIANGYDTCAVTSVPAADVEGAVIDHVRKLLAAPELVGWQSARARTRAPSARSPACWPTLPRSGTSCFRREGLDRPTPRRASRGPAGCARGADQARGAPKRAGTRGGDLLRQRSCRAPATIRTSGRKARRKGSLSSLTCWSDSTRCDSVCALFQPEEAWPLHGARWYRHGTDS